LKRHFGLLLPILALVGGCVAEPGGPSPTDPPALETTTTSPEGTVTTIGAAEGSTRFRECLGDEGIDIEPIPLDAQGRPRLDLVMREVDLTIAANGAALEACSLHLITGALDLTGAPMISEGVLVLLEEFGECMRTRGVPGFPTTVRGFNGVGSPFPVDEIPYDDPDLPGAAQVCRERLVDG
jgi:hypothetical protein